MPHYRSKYTYQEKRPTQIANLLYESDIYLHKHRKNNYNELPHHLNSEYE